MISGQEKICNRINSLSLDKFPRSLMLVGAKGAGKHLIVDYIADKFKLTVLDITTTLDQQSIEEIYTRVEPYIYIIKANELSVKQENAILKFVEEPLKNSYIVLLAETDIGLLPTIINRCQIWYLQNYTKELLSTFVTNDNYYVLSIATTPGQVVELCNVPFNEMIELSDKIIDNIHIASVANTLTLSSKIKFKEEKGFDLQLFVNILLQRLVERACVSSDSRYTASCLLTSELKKKISIKNLDCNALFEKYLIELRTIMKGATV